MLLAYFILVVYGITLIVVESKIAKPLREFIMIRVPFTRKLLSCIMCSGFWVALFVSILFLSPAQNLINPENIIQYGMCSLMDGFLGSGAAYFIWIIQSKFD